MSDTLNIKALVLDTTVDQPNVPNTPSFADLENRWNVLINILTEQNKPNVAISTDYVSPKVIIEELKDIQKVLATDLHINVPNTPDYISPENRLKIIDDLSHRYLSNNDMIDLHKPEINVPHVDPRVNNPAPHIDPRVNNPAPTDKVTVIDKPNVPNTPNFSDLEHRWDVLVDKLVQENKPNVAIGTGYVAPKDIIDELKAIQKALAFDPTHPNHPGYISPEDRLKIIDDLSKQYHVNDDTITINQPQTIDVNHPTTPDHPVTVVNQPNVPNMPNYADLEHRWVVLINTLADENKPNVQIGTNYIAPKVIIDELKSIEQILAKDIIHPNHPGYISPEDRLKIIDDLSKLYHVSDDTLVVNKPDAPPVDINHPNTPGTEPILHPTTGPEPGGNDPQGKLPPIEVHPTTGPEPSGDDRVPVQIDDNGAPGFTYNPGDHIQITDNGAPGFTYHPPVQIDDNGAPGFTYNPGDHIQITDNGAPGFTYRPSVDVNHPNTPDHKLDINDIIKLHDDDLTSLIVANTHPVETTTVVSADAGIAVGGSVAETLHALLPITTDHGNY